MKYLHLFEKAQKQKKPLWQFNFSDLAQLKGIIKGILQFKSPFILGTSEGESNFLGLKLAVAIKKEIEREIGLPIILNLDHGKSYLLLKEAIESGYDMVHFDGSALSLKENINVAKKIVRYAHPKGVLVEGEVGTLKGTSRLHKKIPRIKREELTNPEEAKEFVKKTRVDALAIAIGNIHGIYSKMPSLDLDHLSMIKKIMAERGQKVFFVLHGGSGIGKKALKEAAKRGIVKININTEIRLAWRKGMERDFSKRPNEVAPYRLIEEVVGEVRKVVEKKMKIFAPFRNQKY